MCAKVLAYKHRLTHTLTPLHGYMDPPTYTNTIMQTHRRYPHRCKCKRRKTFDCSSVAIRRHINMKTQAGLAKGHSEKQRVILHSWWNPYLLERIIFFQCIWRGNQSSGDFLGRYMECKSVTATPNGHFPLPTAPCNCTANRVEFEYYCHPSPPPPPPPTHCVEEAETQVDSDRPRPGDRSGGSDESEGRSETHYLILFVQNNSQAPQGAREEWERRGRCAPGGAVNSN